MFSATISREVMDISWVYQRDPVEITVRADQENKPDIAQYRLDVEPEREGGHHGPPAGAWGAMSGSSPSATPRT